jgi:hypothetical protein
LIGFREMRFAFLIFFLFISFIVIGQKMITQSKFTSGKIVFNQSADSRIFLDVSYKQDSFPVMIDSYANYSMFPEEWIARWGLAKTPYIYATRDFNNKRKKVKLRIMDTISVSNQLYATNFYVNPKKTLNIYKVGILAKDFLDDLNWKIDFSNSILCFDTASFNASTVSVKNVFRKGEFPWFNIMVNNIEHKVVVDLGAAQEISLPVNSKIGGYLLSKYQPSPKVVKTGGANSEALNDLQYDILVDSIYLHGVLFENVNVRLSKNTRVSYIGCKFLRRGNLIMNFRRPDESDPEVALELNQ